MSILIKTEMPKGCWACPFAVGKYYECLFTKKTSNWGLTTRPSDCPLIEVPTPHRRLGDLDKLKYDIVVGNEKYLGLNEPCLEDVTPIENVDDCIDAIAFAPTIIDAEWREK